MQSPAGTTKPKPGVYAPPTNPLGPLKGHPEESSDLATINRWVELADEVLGNYAPKRA